ncbi:MAG: hypothetical protein DI552_07630 [Brevundimonas sp.]|nr:MAG: hypothetical protein DI552_07630 [Brevundimonas sp.]
MTNPSAQTATLSDLGAMLRGMTPRLDAETYRFCSITSDAEVAALWGESLSLFREDEGATLILREAAAAQHGLPPSPPMQQIVLEVFSALEGVGLTAAVASALANEGIACNMVAAFHHDHVFVLASSSAKALAVLQSLQNKAIAV